MSEPTMTEVLVAIGRIEEMIKAMNGKLDKLEEQTEERFKRVDSQSDRQWKKINDHEAAIQVLQERQGPKVHFTTWVAMAIAVAGFIAAFVTYIIK
jgi:type VI protein secretion system component VasF